MNHSRAEKILVSSLTLIGLIFIAGCQALPFPIPFLAATPTRTATPLPTSTPVPPPTSVPVITIVPPPTVAPTATPFALSSSSKAATLRATLERLLAEHVVLTVGATGAAIDGRDADLKAAADALDANSVDLSKVIGAGYGAETEKTFLASWRRHLGFFLDYTSGAVAKDKAKQDKALNDLVGYSQVFGAVLNSVNPNLPKDAVADLFRTHILTIKDVIDAQAAKDWNKVYASERKAFAHMDMIATPLASAIAKQFPDKYDGKVDAPGSVLRAALTIFLTEHVHLAFAATNAALLGREAEFRAAADALDANSVDLSKAIGAIYGADAERGFLQLWRKHVGLIVDYAAGLVKKDKTTQDAALANLTIYSTDFGTLLNVTTSRNISADAVNDLVKMHVLTLKDVIDAQSARDSAKTFAALRKAFAHMSAIADPLADAVVKQFPDRFK